MVYGPVSFGSGFTGNGMAFRFEKRTESVGYGMSVSDCSAFLFGRAFFDPLPS